MIFINYLLKIKKHILYYKRLKLDTEKVLNDELSLGEITTFAHGPLSEYIRNSLKEVQQLTDMFIQIIKNNDVDALNILKREAEHNIIFEKSYTYHKFENETLDRIILDQNKRLRDNVDYISNEIFKIANMMYKEEHKEEANEAIEEILVKVVEKLLDPFIIATKEIYEKSSKHVYKAKMEKR